MRVSNLHMRVLGTGDSDAFRSAENQHDAGELRWVEFQIGPYAPTRIGLDRLTVVGEARRNHGAYLSIREFDTLQVTGGIWLEATVAEGVQVDLITRARELDCAGDRVCNRGTGGTVKQTITVPRFAANFTGNCSGRRYQLGDLTDDQARRDYRLGVREEQLLIEPLHDWVLVCFEPVE